MTDITTIFKNRRWKVVSHPIRIAEQDKNAGGSVFFRVYQQFQSDLSESCALFLVRLRSTFRQLVKDPSMRIYVRRSRRVKTARPKLSWTYVTLRIHISYSRTSRGMLARYCHSFAARSALIGSFEQMLLALGYTLDTSSVSVYI